MTWNFVIYDIWSTLKQHYASADITLTHASYWCSVGANRLLSQHIDKRDSGAFLTRYDDLSVLIDTTTNYKYIELPHGIFDFDKDEGVNYISYESAVDDCVPPFTSVRFTRTTPKASKRLYYTDEEIPTPQNPYFYRIGTKLFLLGLESINAPKIEGAFYQTIDPYPQTLTDEFEFPDELISVLQSFVLSLGRFALQVPRDNVNDGVGIAETPQLPKVQSVQNEVTQQQQGEQ